MTPTLCVDIDGVLAFFLEAACAALNARFGTDYRPDATHHYWFESWLPTAQKQWIDRLFLDPGFYAVLAPDLSGIGAVRAIRRSGIPLWVVTDRPATVAPATDDWLRRWQVPVDELAIGPGSKQKVARSATAERPLIFVDDDPRKAATLVGPHLTLYAPRRPFTPRVLPGAIIIDAWQEILDPLGVHAEGTDVPGLGRPFARPRGTTSLEGVLPDSRTR